jgi:hypothetical protein
VRFSFAVLLSHGYSLGMTLDEVSLLSYGAVAAARRICLFRAFPVQEATTAPQTSMGLLPFGPDMAERLAVVALRKASLSSV